jgi:TRAP-type transport system periplasmic protein
MNSFGTMLTLATLAALAAGTGGCKTVDRAGGDAADPVTTLVFAQANHEPPAQLVAWADQVEQTSGGSLEIEFKNGWRMGQTDNETGTIADVRAGKVDLAWVGARVFDRVGVTTFQALLAPMLVDSHELQAAVFRERIPEEMLIGVQDAGVTGIGVLPGPMRKVLGIDKPFMEPRDFRGSVVGMQDSALTQAALESLGATTKAEPSGAELDGLDAYEQQLASIQGNGYVSRARYVTANLDLWPRPLVLIANPDAFEALDDEQRSAISDASEAAVLPALDASRAEDVDAADQLCRQGMLMVEASDDQLYALATAWDPLYDELAVDPATADWLARILALKESVGAGPDASPCSSDEPGADGDDPSDELDGVWTTQLSAVDWREAGFEGPAGSFTLTFDGGYVLVADPGGEIGYQARYSAFRGRLETSDSPDELGVSYRIDGDELVLSDMTVNGSEEPTPFSVVWTTRPFTRQTG